MTRHEARQCAVQALYQIDVSDSEILDAIHFVVEDKTIRDRDLAQIQTLVEGTRSNLIDIDAVLSRAMERWSTERVGRVELNILRLAIYELMFDPTMPTATVLDEAVRLGKDFSTDTAAKFINGVLAKTLPLVRGSAKPEERTGGSADS